MRLLREGDKDLITGQINQAGSPILKITVFGNKSEVTIDGILDTGFDGFICLPIAIAVPLGLELIDVTDSELADGTIIQDELVFAGKILWDDAVVDVDILLTKSTDTLIGTAMLMNSDIRLDYRAGKILIE
jgi:clan AA aspartic protease